MFEIGLDVHAKFNTGGAIRVAKALEPYNVMFLEEPILSEEASAMREVQASTSTPIAAGERLKSRFQMYQYIEKDAIRLSARRSRSPKRISCRFSPTTRTARCAWPRTCTWRPRRRTSASSSRAGSIPTIHGT